MNSENTLAHTEECNFHNLEVREMQNTMNGQMTKIDKELNFLSSVISSVGKTVNDIVTVCQQTKYQIAVLDKQLEAYLIKSNTDLEKFKASLPLMQMAMMNVCGTLDRTTDALLARPAAKTPEEVEDRNAWLAQLQDMRNALNNIIIKVMTK